MSRPLVALVAILVWWNCGSDRYRAEKAQIRSPQDAWARKDRFLWPPWAPLIAYVSHDTDERLYFEYTRVILGEDADLRLIAAQHLGDIEANLRALQEYLPKGPGWRMPYRDLSIEYPPLSVAFMLAPRAITSTLSGYRIVFGALVSACYLLACWLALLLARHLHTYDPPVLHRAAWLTLALGSLLVRRLDVLPSLLVVASLLALCNRRTLLSGILLGAGAGAKIYPLLLLPVWIAWLATRGTDGRRRALSLLSGVTLCAALGLAIMYALLGSNIRTVLSSVAYYGNRPFQIESLPGGILLAIQGAVTSSFGSFNVHSPNWLTTAWSLALPLALVGITISAALSARHDSHEHRPLAWYTAGTLLLILCTSKVLSPQYLIWLLPLAAIYTTRFYRLSLAAVALTQLIYPIAYELVLGVTIPGILLVLARNVLLLILAITALRSAHKGA